MKLNEIIYLAILSSISYGFGYLTVNLRACYTLKPVYGKNNTDRLIETYKTMQLGGLPQYLKYSFS